MNVVVPPLAKRMPEPIATLPVNTVPVNQDNLYQQVAAEYGAALVRLASGYEANAEQRQDLIQDIHVALWQSFANFNKQCSLRTWVYRVAHNIAATHVLRGKRRRSSQLISLEELDEMPSQHSECQADEAVILQRLSQLIQQLKPIDRDVILLYLEGIEAVEIGDIVGLSPSNVAQKIHRIKKLLQRRFENGDSHDNATRK